MDPTPTLALAEGPSQETLRQALLATRDMLKRRRAADIPEGFIDEYVRLRWLEWYGGALRLTLVGENICKQLKSTLQ